MPEEPDVSPQEEEILDRNIRKRVEAKKHSRASQAGQENYRQNRARFSIEQLRQRDGEWVAFSADGQRIVASAATIAELANHVRAAHEDLREVVIEHIEMESTDINLGAAELL